MKLLLIKKGLLSLAFIIFAIILEIFAFSFFGFGFLPTYFLLDLSLIAFISFFSFAIPQYKIQAIFLCVMFFLQGLVIAVNIGIFEFFRDMFTLDFLSQVSAAGQAISLDMLNFGSIALIIFFILCFISVVYILSFIKVKIDYKPKKLLSIVSIGLAAVICCNITFFATSSSIKKVDASGSTILSDRYLYQTLLFKKPSYKKFGTYGFYYANMFNRLNLKQFYDDDKIAEAEKFVSNNDFVSSTKNIKEQYKDLSGIITKNLSTGLKDANQNVIVFLMESTEWFGISKEFTPNLYNMTSPDREKGIALKNYYSHNKTDVSETSVILGSYPLVEGMDKFGKPNSKMPSHNFNFSMPNMLKAKTPIENTTYFHTWKKEFYNRSYQQPLLGFDKTYFLEDIENDRKNGKNNIPPLSFDINVKNLESDIMKNYIDVIAPNNGKPFFTFYTNVVTHGGYFEESPRFEQEGYYTQLEDGNFTEVLEKLNPNYTINNNNLRKYLKNYLAAMIDFDNALGILLDHLTENNLMDNTTIVLFGDHNVTYHNISNLFKKTNYNEPEQYRVPAIIYNTKIDKIDITEKFTNSYDLLPTLLYLMGIEYNKNAYLGNNIFSTDQSVLISKLDAALNDKIFSSDGLSPSYILPTLKDEEVDTALNDFNRLVKERIEKWEKLNLVYYL